MTRFVDKPDFIQPAVNGPSAHLVASLSQAIHEHRLLPGTKLGEDELSEIYNVSRTVVRSALQALSPLPETEQSQQALQPMVELALLRILEDQEERYIREAHDQQAS